MWEAIMTRKTSTDRSLCTLTWKRKIASTGILLCWGHGIMANGDEAMATVLAKSLLKVNTGDCFRNLQKKWFDYWLKGIGDGKFDEATLFPDRQQRMENLQKLATSGNNIKKLYAGPGQKASFTKPASPNDYVSYISDPAKPVPYRTLPIEATYGPGSRWKPWQVEDQRFVYTRPDVVSFTMDSLTNDLTVTGKIKAHLFASTSGTDADWIVKLIDVYPAI